jgi:hypothetical protein
MLRGGELWIPERIQRINAPGRLCRKVFGYSAKIAKRIDSLSKPRMPALILHPLMKVFCIVLLLVGGAVLALPLPPGTNFPPGGMLVLLSLGMLRADALFVGLGLIAAGLNVIFFGALLYLGEAGVSYLLNLTGGLL